MPVSEHCTRCKYSLYCGTGQGCAVFKEFGVRTPDFELPRIAYPCPVPQYLVYRKIHCTWCKCPLYLWYLVRVFTVPGASSHCTLMRVFLPSYRRILLSACCRIQHNLLRGTMTDHWQHTARMHTSSSFLRTHAVCTAFVALHIMLRVMHWFGTHGSCATSGLCLCTCAEHGATSHAPFACMSNDLTHCWPDTDALLPKPSASTKRVVAHEFVVPPCALHRLDNAQ